ncbi:diphosphomevalonate decarboxylase [uncultured Dokdonia sp.]|uniref:diphosphomevalonate/mevalonate 3,5-bisphosphate decarboxylase family protein n=1 Tax=uncultured Dokdonia sp. TaxID=575653 RepID=UPI0030EDA361|tara:strand:- start:153542 stop:154624 length:1083 start_codon:yes stop_codon:yes gene_type:complete
MTESDFIPSGDYQVLPAGSVSYQSPSNIALVKYWGKYGEQLPQNPSISFTLSNCHTTTTLSYKKNSNTSGEIPFEIFLDGEAAPDFKPKIAKFFERIAVYMPFVKEYEYKIETSNSFPHSSGIASSASGMSALALCLMEMERGMEVAMTDTFFNEKASFLARLGSGSACRSIEGPLVVWGKHAEIEGSTNFYGTSYEGEIHEKFHNYQDTILLVDKGEKQVSSTVGHDLMHGHAFAKARFTQAHENLSSLMQVFKQGDVDQFIKIVESEALTLHAMMMTSHPYFILMKPKTLEIINEIWAYRNETSSKICFTLDAGANVHVLYPENEMESVQKFIASELSKFCQNSHYIDDCVGNGAKKL